MCLISVCPKGTVKDSDQVYDFIRSGAKCNPAGSGFMYKRNGTEEITVKKGYFNVEKLISDLKELKLTKDDELVIHHRIPTYGDRNDVNTHPFVVSTVHEEVCNVNITTKKPALAHNGSFSIHQYQKLNSNMSDTYAFARYILGNQSVLSLLREDQELFEYLLKDVISYNKIAILFPEKDLITIGNFTEKDGYLHSNQGYCTYVRNVGGVEEDDDYSIETHLKNHFGNKQLSIGFRSKSAMESASVFREHEIEASHSRTRENRHVSLPRATQSGLTKIVLLDNRYVDLTSSNIRQFNFVRKKDWDAFKTGNGNHSVEMFHCDNFNVNTELQTTTQNEDGCTIFKTIPTRVLMNDCYYIPKGDYYYNIYSDYKHLVDLSIEPTKNGIKELQKTIDRNYIKTAQDPILYKKLRRKFCKLSLQMHLADLIWVSEEPKNLKELSEKVL